MKLLSQNLLSKLLEDTIKIQFLTKDLLCFAKICEQSLIYLVYYLNTVLYSPALLAIAVKESAKVGGKGTSLKGVDDLGNFCLQIYFRILYVLHCVCLSVHVRVYVLVCVHLCRLDRICLK